MPCINRREKSVVKDYFPNCLEQAMENAYVSGHLIVKRSTHEHVV